MSIIKRKDKAAAEHTSTQLIQEEIRTRVFERYAELQGVQSEEHELKATLEALHEITHIPLVEIENIANDVMQQQRTPTNPARASIQELKLLPTQDFTFERLQHKVKKKKRTFTPHLIAYICVNAALLCLNAALKQFPWVIFPMLGWGIGLASHYFRSVRWPAKDLQNTMTSIKSQIHQVLQENISRYHTQEQTKIFNGVYRLLVAESSQEMIADYLKSVDPEMTDREMDQATIQLCAIRQKYLKA